MRVLNQMSDRVKIYKRAFYTKNAVYNKQSNTLLLKMEENRKKLLKARNLQNKLDGTNLLSSYSKFKLKTEETENSEEDLADPSQPGESKGVNQKKKMIRKMT